MTNANPVNGECYLLLQEPNGTEQVVRYTTNEMAECFTEAELGELRSTLRVVRKTRFGLVVYIDMVAAARANFE